MNFNKHFNLVGKHATLSASKYHWIRYSDEKFDEYLYTQLAAQRGTELHAFASEAIRLGVKLKGTKQTLNLYVNDAIGFRMKPEQVLRYSDFAFGTADAISFNAKTNLLRIHDLKTGVSKASFDQLQVYAAFFCLEYGFKPAEITMELRIYQNDEIQIYFADADDVTHIMDRIIVFDRRISQIRMEALD